MAKNLNLGNFLTISRWHISKSQIFLKNRFHSNWRPYLVLTSGQKPKKSLEPFLRKILKCLILGWFGDLFVNLSKLRIFFRNPALSLFCLYSPLTSCKKSEKSLELFLRKLRYQPTNQPIIANNANFIGPGWRRTKKKFNKKYYDWIESFIYLK